MWLAVAGLLLFFALRLHNIAAIPLFIDESLAIERAENIRNGILLQHASQGKLLLPYYLLPFSPQAQAVWVSRVSLLLLLAPGLAACVAIARRYAGAAAVAATLLLMTLSPMLFFFDRLALADTMLQALLCLWVWSLCQAFDRRAPNGLWTAASSLLFASALLAKASALFLLPLPLVISLILPAWSPRQRAKSLARIYAGIAILLLPFLAALAALQLDYFGNYGYQGMAAESALLSLDRIWDNLLTMLLTFSGYHSLPFIISAGCLCILALLYRPRAVFALLAGPAGYALALALFGRPGLYHRYYLPILPLLFVAASIGLSLVEAPTRARQNLRLFPLTFPLLLLWLMAFAAPLVRQIQLDPHTFDPPGANEDQYFRLSSSGYGIPQLADFLEDRAEDAIVVEGAFVGCYTLKLYLWSEPSVAVQCPNVLSGDRRAKYLNARLPSQLARHERYYLVLEDPGYVSEVEIVSVRLTPIADFPRPGGLNVIQLYSVSE